MVILITIATFFSTLFGGLFALRLKDKLHLILGFSAGAIIGVAFFDLLPEALDLASKVYSASTVLTVVVIGFTTYLILDRMVLLHGHTDNEGGGERRGNAGAGSLSFHSFLDGVGIGLAFHVSPIVGAVVAAAVLTHDFSDGINTVNLILKNGGERSKAFRWLLVDAIAPVLGVLSTLLFVLPEDKLGLLLALFSGFFLYIGASDLIPESYHSHPRHWTTIMTVVGIGTLYVIIRLASM
ncbi:MAG TPA: ZIP family metal transporter [Candidatus Paceibacterota bacterium]|nr:ZIP family metal transporter [Candidatus Paceibacterota bacterium]